MSSTFIYGSVGTADAALTINGHRVEVYPNGAFLAFLPVPTNGQWELEAVSRGQSERLIVAYRRPAAARPGATPATAPTTESFAAPRSGRVTSGADTLATGSDVVIGRPTPTGPYTWFLPRGARLIITGQRGDQYRARLVHGVDAWFPAQSVQLGAVIDAMAPAVLSASLVPFTEWTDVRISTSGAPFLVQTEPRRLSLLLYGRPAPLTGGHASSHTSVGSDFVGSLHWETAPEGARLVASLQEPVWGYKAFYEPDGTLVLRIRRPPTVDRSRPLSGIRVVVDPGHPPGGATGPTGLTEAEANLNIALPLAELLRSRGAEVYLTRTDNTSVSLTDRVELATRTDAHILVSVHNNAFGEGANPFLRHGTSTYYFHPHAVSLARWLQREIQSVTQIPDLGVLSGNLALARPSWMPAVLTESVFMPLPDQEAALRDRRFSYALALAHLRAIEGFLLEH